ncbi:3-oxoacyl-[acyl-carrier-protein] synthase-3 [Haloactinopolyspora alba]|uniref:Beta-ketoacyl-[acyl-carrier-protein] synthase III n=1 Tax=Haloactinopolyspora alba TaxID=648780 RepID=A0A2P8EFT9_9ACTN|nr:beta-ketoacyl-ACP synthase III [Haloactinopolyspora alba]PSL08331.1 3-oxoacyl-[acyl-carrier-protein] synthase-3 [Haloactinopolyspora alba]
MSGSRIVGLGHHQPEHVLTNDDLAAVVDTNDTWIRERTGIATRHIARTESVTDLATPAAERAVAAARLDPAEIDLVVVATCSAMDRVPSIAAQVARRLGIPAAAAYDLNNGCAGFCTALATADLTVRGGAARHALVVGAEKMSDVTDWTDRSTCVLLGDGAGAAVLSATESPGVGPVTWGSDPQRGDTVLLAGAWQPRFSQEGQSVFRWASTEMVPVALDACERADVTPADLGAVVTHQANLRIVEAIVRRLGADKAVVARDVIESGNTSAASVPLALSKLVARGDVTPGSPALLLGFGGGLSWAGQVVITP